MAARIAPSTLSVAYVQQLMAAGAQHGVPEGSLVAWAGGVGASVLDAPRGRISVKQFSRMYSALARVLDDESAGLCGRAVPPGSFETLVRSAATASTLAESLQVVAHCLNATLPTVLTRFVAESSRLGVRMSARGPIAEGVHDTRQLITLTFYGALSWLFGRRVPLCELAFAGAPPSHARDLAALYRCPLRFGSASTEVWFALELAQLRPIRTSEEIPSFVRRAPGSLLDALFSADALAAQVRALVHARLPALLSLDEAAHGLGMSPRSLHRRLADEATSFQRVKDELRRDMAIHALTRSKAPLKQIALDVGFADQAAFQRAFAHWTGRAPGGWRKPRGPST